MNILELIGESHEISKEKGFWEGEKNHSETVLLIIANVGEVVKAHKNKRRADWTAYASAESSGTEFKVMFKEHIKDTLEDEMANVIIRICDFIGGTNVNIFKLNPWMREYANFPLNEFFMHAQVSGIYEGQLAEWLHAALWECASYPREKDHGLTHLMCYIGRIVSEMDIDIERHIEMKLKYNRTRPKLYGKFGINE